MAYPSTKRVLPVQDGPCLDKPSLLLGKCFHLLSRPSELRHTHGRAPRSDRRLGPCDRRSCTRRSLAMAQGVFW